MNRLLAVFGALLLVGVGCAPASEPSFQPSSKDETLPSGTDAPGDTPGAPPVRDEDPPSCRPTPVWQADPAAAERGRQELLERAQGKAVFPKLALANLWVVWGTGKPADYWAAFRERYGMFSAPYPNGVYPMGIRAVDTNTATLDCMLCHAGRVAGKSVVGAPNSELDAQLFLEDLANATTLAGQPRPQYKQDLTGARGANDAMGLGLWLSKQLTQTPEGLNDWLGYQDPPAWWTLKYKPRTYLDGSGDPRSVRNSMAFLLSFGLSETELHAKEPAFKDIHEYLLTLEPPVWEGAVDAAKVSQGRSVFRATCSRCHGDYECGSYPGHVEPVNSVGTDPLRATRYRELEVAFVNSGWFGQDYPQKATGGYLAPNLRGLWASAPYFHNGSAPTVYDVLSSTQRPKYFRRLGSEPTHYDSVKLGWKVEALDAGQDPTAPRAERDRVYDTTLPGLANTGHTYGDALTDDERFAVIEYLKTL